MIPVAVLRAAPRNPRSCGSHSDLHCVEVYVDKEASWSLSQKVLFRALFSYFPCCCSPTTRGHFVPFAGKILDAYDHFWHVVALWIASHFLHVATEIPYFGVEVDDTEAGWILFSCYVILAIVAALVWSVLDRKRSGPR
jgi:hypothetical protein